MVADMETLSINTIRCLAADIVQKSNSGHPGAPMGCAPMAQVLWSKFIRCNPANPHWVNRDRFVLSNGHACALQYIMLHLLGYDLTIHDLQMFRQLNSKTPGHPEANHGTPGIEVSTGPLGQGLANAVGLAMAQAHMAARFNNDLFQLIDNFTYVIMGDGCHQEGVSHEAAALAGHLQLGRLIVLYDDNLVSIDGETHLSFTEDVLKRYEAYGWHTQAVPDGDHNVQAIYQAIETAQQVLDKPSIIKIRTVIGFGSKNQGNAHKVHGNALGDDDVAHVKRTFGFPPDKKFFVPDEVSQFWAKIKQRGAELEAAWNEKLEAYRAKCPELHAELTRRFSGKLPDGWKNALPSYTPSDPAVASRKSSEIVLNRLAPMMPELMGGSADLTPSNLTRWKDAIDFQPPNTKLGSYAGRYIRFGVREHGMAAICNGLHAYGGIIPFGATFLNFITYAWGAVRLSALSRHQVLYIMTHDSIGLGEDGPTHQPIETMAAIRALPNLLDFRPADGNEVSGAYAVALETPHRPSVLALSRQNLPNLEGSSIQGVYRGGYVLTSDPSPQVVLVATGSEVSIAVAAGKILASEGYKVRYVSMPCTKLFDEQDVAYKLSVFPEGVPSVSVEAMSTYGWAKYAHVQIGMTTFGSSAPYNDVYKFYEIVPDKIAAKAKKLIEFYKSNPVPSLFKKPF
ncbi:hypothetical protein SeMB42_g00364 [Synchytrium endobioticum]|uniref:Transketolase n=1 Tax=Synchytrium endobioticum TaxID=286115 RepID=A0A507DEB3_9FUNG|nr:hypothetical protein SeLEV6574_g01295 [Synchytrium endobioticum]TPX54265.1 hypothetical protein SeMB42_g00364 [Synchytrium endobioticum]